MGPRPGFSVSVCCSKREDCSLFLEEFIDSDVIADDLRIRLNNRKLVNRWMRYDLITKNGGDTVGRYVVTTSDAMSGSPMAIFRIRTGGCGRLKYAFMMYGWTRRQSERYVEHHAI